MSFIEVKVDDIKLINHIINGIPISTNKVLLKYNFLLYEEYANIFSASQLTST